MPRARRLLHVATALTCVVGVAVALGAFDDGRAGSGDATVALPSPASAPTTTTIAAESFAPANVADTFEIGPVAPPVRTVPSTTPPATTAPPATGAGPAPASDAPVGIAAAASDTSPQMVATLLHAVGVYPAPGARSPIGSLAMTTEFGNPRVLPVVQQGGDWLRVELPTRPNGSAGWIRARDARLSTVADRVDVDLGARVLSWTRDGVEQLRTTVAVGAPATPTPGGDFFVTDVLPYPTGSEYGAWVVALNGHSDAFTEFEGGDARIAIHGTNDPSSIGQAASNGCVRVTDDVLAALAASLPPGTPVTIH